MRLISYAKLWALMAARNMPKTQLLADKIVVGQSYTNLVRGQSMTMRTLDRLCSYLGCQPGDILEYMPDATDSAKDEV